MAGDSTRAELIESHLSNAPPCSPLILSSKHVGIAVRKALRPILAVNKEADLLRSSVLNFAAQGMFHHCSSMKMPSRRMSMHGRWIGSGGGRVIPYI